MRYAMPPSQLPHSVTSVLDRDAMLNSDELAEYLRVPVTTLDQWASRGGGPPYHRVGKYRRYAPADVRSWLAEQRRDPAA
jgi:excisionase family DNA binding protein